MDEQRGDAVGAEGRQGGRRAWIVVLGLGGLVVAAVLAFGVFGVHTLFVDDTVDEAGPTFRSGASAAPADADEQETTTSAAPDGSESDGSAPEAPEPVPTQPAAPQVTEAGRGTFQAEDHPGEGTAVILTDGQQSFVRFEDDFSTDNGPDLYVVVEVGGERVELGRLKGNRGAQNYELPASIDPSAVEQVEVWCKRFDSTFTTAALS